MTIVFKKNVKVLTGVVALGACCLLAEGSNSVNCYERPSIQISPDVVNTFTLNPYAYLSSSFDCDMNIEKLLQDNRELSVKFIEQAIPAMHAYVNTVKSWILYDQIQKFSWKNATKLNKLGIDLFDKLTADLKDMIPLLEGYPVINLEKYTLEDFRSRLDQMLNEPSVQDACNNEYLFIQILGYDLKLMKSYKSFVFAWCRLVLSNTILVAVELSKLDPTNNLVEKLDLIQKKALEKQQRKWNQHCLVYTVK